MSAFADAQRFLDIRNGGLPGGWTDPTVDPFEMIAELIAARDEDIADMVTQECYDEDIAAKDEEIEELKKAHDQALDDAARNGLKTASVEDLMHALADAIKREAQAAYTKGEEKVTAQWDAVRQEQARKSAREWDEKKAKKVAARTRKSERARNTNIETPAVDSASKGT